MPEQRECVASDPNDSPCEANASRRVVTWARNESTQPWTCLRSPSQRLQESASAACTSTPDSVSSSATGADFMSSRITNTSSSFNELICDYGEFSGELKESCAKP